MPLNQKLKTQAYKKLAVDRIVMINPFVKLKLVSPSMKVQASAQQTFADVFVVDTKKKYFSSFLIKAVYR